MDNKIKIGIIGLGTVGQGVVKVLNKFDDIDIVGAAVKNISKKRDVELNWITDNVYDLVRCPDINLIVEVAGGCALLDPIKEAIKNHKHIVTANKELLAKHGAEIFDLARENNVVVLYEAAVAGGIPIIMPIKMSLRANNFTSVTGILNGTTNYILTKMDEENLSYDECLKEAQKLGYAETNPTGDTEGYDSMYKICILANIVFNKRINSDEIYREGITNISPTDMQIANELGYKIKLIAQAKKYHKKGDDNSLDIRVHPMLVPKSNSLSEIKNSLNAILLNGFPVDSVMFVGPGAGEFPTSSSVVGDILAIKAEINRGGEMLPMTICHHRDYATQVKIEDTVNCYYIRIIAGNEPGTIGKIGTCCGKYDINLSCIIQRGLNSDGRATIIVVTEECYQKNIDSMVKELESDEDICVVNRIRVM